jgi:hypothetical protein
MGNSVCFAGTFPGPLSAATRHCLNRIEAGYQNKANSCWELPGMEPRIPLALGRFPPRNGSPIARSLTPPRPGSRRCMPESRRCPTKKSRIPRAVAKKARTQATARRNHRTRRSIARSARKPAAGIGCRTTPPGTTRRRTTHALANCTRSSKECT